MKKYLFLALLIPSLSQAWTLAQIQQNLQVPAGSAKLSCSDSSNEISYPFTTNAQSGTAAGTDNVKLGFSATNNVTGPVNNIYTATGNAAVTVYKNINIYYTYGGVNKVAVVPAGTYWGNPTSSWRKTNNNATVYVPSTGLPSSMRFTGLPLYWTDPGNPNVTSFIDSEFKVTITLPNGSPAHFWFHCV